MEKGIIMLYTRRLPLEEISNIRDLGGYPTKGGGHTKFGVFVRSARPCHITEGDKEFLKSYGVTLSLDFRSLSEAKKYPSDLIGLDWVEYRPMPLDVHHVIISEEGEIPKDDREYMTWPEVYKMMAEDYKPWFKEVLEVSANCDGAMQFHCTTGKDRTGLISALLLGLAGVSDEDIIADYSISQIYLEPVYKELIASSVKWASELSMENVFFKTAPYNMRALLDHYREKYGGIREYVKDIGVSDEDVQKIISKFTEKRV